MGWWAAAAAGAAAGKGGQGTAATLRKWTARGAKTAAVLHVTFNYVAFFSQINGPSMFPTFSGRGWNVVVAEALPGMQDRVAAGDVVICIRPVNARENVIKRVTAVAGQRVTLFTRGGGAPTTLEVPTGHIWLQGDNLIMSRDSREYGPVPLAMVKGRVVCQILPNYKWVPPRLPGQP
ncbi:mitochondrial inner membrane protease subunit 1 [Raphidocelis subcapitata]|uniref:Mitochondrial inner membrane protease subunit 1 n=1 Tax=Raphidocelis subcapitata TaxID=307507 RepID=A0A2V0PIC5_9CHLO|nr:mitochondrial inner membrane protease subunit 1 [Raphidocelis subcapitata]|eukprot:GBF97650.1 mitochondrial inner membrane protease subunit 1 [Raphidocelis subcapitata]